MKNILLIICLFFTLIKVNAQGNFNADFVEANTLVLEKQYNIALPKWLDLIVQSPENSNINYKIGLCYLKSANEKNKGLKYLTKASENTTKKLRPFFSYGEKSTN
jgi:hypothetical protein